MVLVSLKDLNQNKKIEEATRKKKQQQRNKTKNKDNKRKRKNGKGKKTTLSNSSGKKNHFRKVVFIHQRFLMICLTQNFPRLSEVF